SNKSKKDWKTAASNPSLDRGSLAFASITVGLSLVNSPFNFFYVKVFLEVFGVLESDFQTVQILFLVWNTINDPLFAYFLDKRQSGLCCRTRRSSIKIGAPLLGIIYAITWLPWGQPDTRSVGIQLFFALCLYDSVMGSLTVSWSVAFLNLISHNLADFRSFQLGCLVLAVLATVFVYIGGRYSSSVYDKQQAQLDQDSHRTESGCVEADAACQSTADASLSVQLRQIVLQRDFLAFVVTNFLQIFEASMWANFLSIFMEPLGPASPLQRSGAYLLISLLPALAVVGGLPLIRRFGHHRAVLLSLVFKVAAGPLLHLTGVLALSRTMFAVYSVACCSLNSAAFSLFDLPLSELVDRDRLVNSRRLPLSSTVFGLNALVTKPAISLAPLVVVQLLNMRGYQTYRSAASNSFGSADAGGLTCPQALSNMMLMLACYLPAVIGCLQLISWSFYRIRSKSNLLQAQI
uniref:Zgc:171489 n=2 Tax=Macrostomum lignano TaxID=282301 RepID=A0A1I8HRC3_9PLAT